MASKKLDPLDEIQKSYRIGYGRKEGFLMLSKRKLMFTERRGFFRTSFNVVLEIPYNKIDEVAVEGSHRLTITDTEGGKHVLASFAEVSASIIEGDLKDLIKAS